MEPCIDIFTIFYQRQPVHPRLLFQNPMTIYFSATTFFITKYEQTLKLLFFEFDEGIIGYSKLGGARPT